MQSKVISTVEEYVKVYESGEKLDSECSISKNLFARVLKGNSPVGRSSLTEHPEDRTCFCFTGKGMLEIIGKSPEEIVAFLGFRQQYIQEKLKKKFVFEFLVSEATETFRPILADWKGVEYMLKNFFPSKFHKYWDIFEKDILTKTYKEIEEEAPYSFYSVRSSGYKNERYLTEERFAQLIKEEEENQTKITLWQWRLFLYLNTGTRELFSGDGYAVDAVSGEKTSLEFFLPNILRKDLPEKHVFLPLNLKIKL